MSESTKDQHEITGRVGKAFQDNLGKGDLETLLQFHKAPGKLTAADILCVGKNPLEFCCLLKKKGKTPQTLIEWTEKAIDNADLIISLKEVVRKGPLRLKPLRDQMTEIDAESGRILDGFFDNPNAVKDFTRLLILDDNLDFKDLENIDGKAFELRNKLYNKGYDLEDLSAYATEYGFIQLGQKLKNRKVQKAGTSSFGVAGARVQPTDSEDDATAKSSLQCEQGSSCTDSRQIVDKKTGHAEIMSFLQNGAFTSKECDSLRALLIRRGTIDRVNIDKSWTGILFALEDKTPPFIAEGEYEQMYKLLKCSDLSMAADAFAGKVKEFMGIELKYIP